MSHTNDVLERALVSALQADPELRELVAKRLGRAYTRLEFAASEASEAGTAGAASEAGKAGKADSGKSKSEALVATVVNITDEHYVFELPIGWPVFETTPKGGIQTRIPPTGAATKVAAGDHDGTALTKSVIRRRPRSEKQDKLITEGDEFQIFDKLETASKAGSKPKKSKRASKAGKSKKGKAKKVISKADKRKLKRVADHTKVKPKGLAYKPTQCTCREDHDCPAVSEFGEANPFKATS